LLPQFRDWPTFDSTKIRHGFELILWGFFKKLVIADRLSHFVDPIYNTPRSYFGMPLIAATYAFALQIYFDFSGYSDIALVSAHNFGIRLMNNFNLPYSSDCITEFWRRWHISMTSWFRDYVYVPLSSSLSKFRISVNLLIVFVLSGFWHGAQEKFVA